MKSGSPTDTVVKFTAAAIGSIALIGAALVWVAHDLTESEAVRDARNLTLASGRDAIAPVLTDGILTRDPAAIAAVDQAVHRTVLNDDIVRVKIWSPDGTIVYSDEPRNIGLKFELDEDELEAFKGEPAAELSDLDKQENEHERQFNKLLEVYDAIKTPSGQPVLFEAYLRYDTINNDASRLLGRIFIPLIGGLFVLLLLQIPLALGLARRLERGQEERERLMRSSIEISEAERRRIASDLHDGVVQRLVGTSYSLSATGSALETKGLADEAQGVAKAATELRTSVKELRSMIITIAPPRLRDEGLGAAVSDLTDGLVHAGVKVSCKDLDVADALSTDTEALLYRFIQEAVRNITKHAQATEVGIEVALVGNDRVRCLVRDNGVGFESDLLALRQAGGHVGLSLLAETIAVTGGVLRVESNKGEGTTLTMEVPVQ